MGKPRVRVRRSDVNDIDVRRAVHRPVIIVAIDLGDAPLLGGGFGVLGGATNRGDLHAEAFEAFDVNGADEASADDASAEVMERFHLESKMGN